MMKKIYLLSFCLSVLSLDGPFAMDVQEPAPGTTPLPLLREEFKQKITAARGLMFGDMQGFLQEATAKPYLWPTLLEVLPQIFYPKDTAENAQERLIIMAIGGGSGPFEGIPAAYRCAYLEHIVAQGTIGAKDAQERLTLMAFHGSDLFEGISPAERLTYVEGVVKRGTFGAENAQLHLILMATDGFSLFKGTPVEERRTYLEGVVKRGTFGAAYAQEMLNSLPKNN